MSRYKIKRNLGSSIDLVLFIIILSVCTLWTYKADGIFHLTLLWFRSIIKFQWIAGGLLGQDGVLVIRPVDVVLDIEADEWSDMPKMAGGNVLEVVGKAHPVMENNVQAQV